MQESKAKRCEWCKRNVATDRSGRYLLCKDCLHQERGSFGIIGGGAVMVGRGGLPRAISAADAENKDREEK